MGEAEQCPREEINVHFREVVINDELLSIAVVSTRKEAGPTHKVSKNNEAQKYRTSRVLDWPSFMYI